MEIKNVNKGFILYEDMVPITQTRKGVSFSNDPTLKKLLDNETEYSFYIPLPAGYQEAIRRNQFKVREFVIANIIRPNNEDKFYQMPAKKDDDTEIIFFRENRLFKNSENPPLKMWSIHTLYGLTSLSFGFQKTEGVYYISEGVQLLVARSPVVNTSSSTEDYSSFFDPFCYFAPVKLLTTETRARELRKKMVMYFNFLNELVEKRREVELKKYKKTNSKLAIK